MLQNDYLMRIIFQMVEILRKSLREERTDPSASSAELEQSLANAVDMEPSLFFSLAPESMVTLLSLGDFDSRLAPYLVRGMALDAELLEQSGRADTASLRRSQLDSLARAYGLEVTEADLDTQAIAEFLDGQVESESDEPLDWQETISGSSEIG